MTGSQVRDGRAEREVEHVGEEGQDGEKRQEKIKKNKRYCTFAFLFDRFGFRDGETLHGLVFLMHRVLLVGQRPHFAVSVRVDQHTTVKGVAVPVRRITAAMVH